MAGHLIDGKWETCEGFSDTDGSFNREESNFRRWITPEGKAGPEGQEAVPAEKHRYHLYVSYACPWAHRTLIFRHLKELEELISVNVVHPHMLEEGWTFKKNFEATTGDALYGKDYLHQIYTLANLEYTGKATVPVLWDKKEKSIVNNESAEIIRIFNTAFNTLSGNNTDYYPKKLRNEIDAFNDRIYHTLNNGVYKCGFAERQQSYEDNVVPLFKTLDWLEGKLSDNRLYLLGEKLTEADIRLFTTLIRFDPVYYLHFKCNMKQVRDYSALNSYMLRLYEMPQIKPTVHFDHIKQHYYYSHKHINPHRIVPLGPKKNYGLPPNPGHVKGNNYIEK